MMQHPLTMTAPDPELRWPEITVADGRRTIGFVFVNDDGTATATGPLDEPLGSFHDVATARQAVVKNGKGARP